MPDSIELRGVRQRPRAPRIEDFVPKLMDPAVEGALMKAFEATGQKVSAFAQALESGMTFGADGYADFTISRGVYIKAVPVASVRLMAGDEAWVTLKIRIEATEAMELSNFEVGFDADVIG